MPGPVYRQIAQVIMVAALATACFAASLARGQTDENPRLEQDSTPVSAESWMEQGRTLLAEGYFHAATDLYYRALETNRAELGLYNLQQIPILEQLLETHLLTRNWSGFDRRLQYLEWLQPHILGDDPVAHANALSRLADLHVAAAARIHADKSAWHLVRARQLNWQAVTVLQTHFGRDDLRLAPLLYRISLIHYYQMTSIYRRGLTSFEFRSDQPVISNGWAYSMNENQRRSYSIGVELLTRIERLYSADGNASPEAAALARVYLADWHLLFGRGNLALDIYQDVRLLLAEQGVTEDRVNAYFDRNVMLPESHMNLSLAPLSDQSQADATAFHAWSDILPGVPLPNNHPAQRLAGHQQILQAAHVPVTVTLDTRASNTSTGNTSSASTDASNTARQPGSSTARFSVNIAALTMNESAGPATGQRAMHDLRALQFRPRLQNGNLLETQEVPLTYVPAPP